MAPFDIIDASGNAYLRVWQERTYLMRLAFVPIFMKFIGLVMVFALGVEDDQLRLTLVLLPAYFAEGWMISHFTRLIFLDQRWPFMPSGDTKKDEVTLHDRARGIMAGTVIYVLIQMVLASYMEALLKLNINEIDPDRIDMKMVAILAFFVSLWAFRFLWIYIPAAVNYDLKSFIKKLGGLSTSLAMIGVWLVCWVPGLVLMIFGTFPVIFDQDERASTLLKMSGLLVQSTLEAIIILLVTAGMAYAVRDMVERQERSKNKS